MEDKLKIYRDNFEAAYIEATSSFYKTKAPQYLADNGVQVGHGAQRRRVSVCRLFVTTQARLDVPSVLLRCKMNECCFPGFRTT